MKVFTRIFRDTLPALLLGIPLALAGCQAPSETSSLNALSVQSTEVSAQALMSASSVETVLVQTGSEVYRFDPSTKAMTKLFAFKLRGRPFDLMYDIAISPQGELYGVSSSWLYAIDPSTGALRALRRLDDLGIVNCASFLPDGRLLLGGSGLQLLDLTTYAISTLVPEGQYVSSGDVALLPDGYLYWSVNENWNGAGDTLVRVHPRTGAVQVIGTLGERGVYGLVYVDGQLFGFTSGGYTLLINPLNATTTRVGVADSAWNGAAAWTPIPAPQPSPVPTPIPSPLPSPLPSPSPSPSASPAPVVTPRPTAWPSDQPCVGISCGGGPIGL